VTQPLRGLFNGRVAGHPEPSPNGALDSDPNADR